MCNRGDLLNDTFIGMLAVIDQFLYSLLFN